jgi:uncharacterized nucleotidyltransferase DUF6036
MTMPLQTLDLWNLVRKRPQIDPRDLAEAICGEVRHMTLDYRTRLLVRDSVEALRLHWGSERLADWLSDCPEREQIQTICRESFDKIGYPSLRNRLMEKTDPDKIREFFGYLGNKLTRDIRVEVAGSVALILPGYLSRHTEDIDVVGEVPSDIRENHRLVAALESTFGLKLSHVQSHYFPSGWRSRVHSFDVFDHLHVFLVDVYDVALSKCFSARLKDFQDLTVLKPQLDKDVLIDTLRSSAQDFLAEPRLKKLAQDNWKVLYGEPLPQ